MRRITTVYMAGPDVFFPDARSHARRKHALCAAAGFEGIDPLDASLQETRPSEGMAREIYANCVLGIKRADALIANLSPWRGPGCDPGTAFEVGFAAALGKPVFAYLNVPSDAEADHRERVEAMIGALRGEDGQWRDGEGRLVEDFGLPENLMLWAEARRFFTVTTPDVAGDLTGLKLALDALRVYTE